MKRFSLLCQRLESVPFTRSKPEILAEYLRAAHPGDASWALYLLLGGQLARAIAPAELEAWILEESRLPAWLWQECREKSGDLPETVALIAELSQPEIAAAGPAHGLQEWIEQRLQPLVSLPAPERRAAVSLWWRTLSLDVSWAVHALAVGRFPVHVPRRVVEDAVRLAWGSDAVAGITARIQALSLNQLDLFSKS